MISQSFSFPPPFLNNKCWKNVSINFQELYQVLLFNASWWSNYWSLKNHQLLEIFMCWNFEKCFYDTFTTFCLKDYSLQNYVSIFQRLKFLNGRFILWEKQLNLIFTFFPSFFLKEKTMLLRKATKYTLNFFLIFFIKCTFSFDFVVSVI